MQSIRADMEACGEIPHTDTRTDSTGREQVSSKPERAPSADSPAEPEVDLSTVDMESTGEIPQSDTRTSGDGRERPASKPESTSAPATPEAFEERYGMRPDEADALLSSGLVKDREEFDQAAVDLANVDMGPRVEEMERPAAEARMKAGVKASDPGPAGAQGVEPCWARRIGVEA